MVRNELTRYFPVGSFGRTPRDVRGGAGGAVERAAHRHVSRREVGRCADTETTRLTPQLGLAHFAQCIVSCRCT